jgi:hypothetical protein
VGIGRGRGLTNIGAMDAGFQKGESGRWGSDWFYIWSSILSRFDQVPRLRISIVVLSVRPVSARPAASMPPPAALLFRCRIALPRPIPCPELYHTAPCHTVPLRLRSMSLRSVSPRCAALRVAPRRSAPLRFASLTPLAAVATMDYVNKYEGRTLWGEGRDLVAKWGATKVIMRARPAGESERSRCLARSGLGVTHCALRKLRVVRVLSGIIVVA